jgi:hypothetical protein
VVRQKARIEGGSNDQTDDYCVEKGPSELLAVALSLVSR